MHILRHLPSFGHSNSGTVANPKIQRLPVTQLKTGVGLPAAARALFRASRGSSDRGFPPMPQHGGGTASEWMRNSRMDRRIRMHRNPNRFGVHETTSKH